MSCLLPELEQYRAMDDMADWGVTHLKDEPPKEDEQKEDEQ